ncbi:transposable element Tc1 transposase [Caerostris extrusa]|uniref:Transposable element Tc1 transposase n=1 Tax=Caerostris extrusa TaxID=172846 RepID=A0AAV4SYC8_CAEEX|nr:transposable element Tc1 transposase [Caerostris extrusa]
MNIKLSDLNDKLGSYLRALGETTSNYAAMLYPVVESCLPVEILKAWDRYRLSSEVKRILFSRRIRSAISGLFGGGISPASEHGRFSVAVESLDRKYSASGALLDQPKICSPLPRIRDKTLLTKLASRGIVLTDVGRDTPPIRILLGADVLGSILTGRIKVFTSGLSAVETLLGWTILRLRKKIQVVNMVTLSLQNIE